MEGHWLASRDETIVPAECYAWCNNAYLEAQRVGKSPELCDNNSTFNDLYSKCRECIQAWPGESKITLIVYLEPTFFQFIDYCSSGSAQSVVVTLPASFFVTQTTTSWAVFTKSDGEVSSSAVITVLKELDSDVWVRASPSTTQNITTSTIRNSTYTPPTSSAPTSEPTKFPTDESQDATDTKASANPWIVLASILSVLLSVVSIGGILLLIRRRRRRAKEQQRPEETNYESPKVWERSQLHSDYIPRPGFHELESIRPPQELDGIAKPYPSTELDATGDGKVANYAELGEADNADPRNKRNEGLSDVKDI
ncbi:hypothetical protein QBC38DRAFT_514235 [Podospora fimiseda]|uniref:Transmembrane protein n=1 Tax=Podospora fimiseda TaxID=252190 RepID=A0AAN7BZK1_9PEZI|nr:hypothetical protein QBC38DRAFT_514235 [Podospora fimiseda]